MTAVAPAQLRKVAPRDDAALVERNALSWIVAHPHYLDRDDAPKREHFSAPEGRELFDWIGLCREKSDPISPGDLSLLVSEHSKAWLRWMLDNPPSLGGSAAGLFAALAERHRRAEALRALEAARHDLESGSPTADVAARVRDRLEAVSAPRSNGLPLDFDLWTPLPERPWLIEGLGLGPGAANGFFGFSYSAKTLMTQTLAVDVAADRHVFGQWRAKQQTRVLHVDNEQGSYETKLRYQLLARGRGVDPAELAGWIGVSCFGGVYLTMPDAESIYCRAIEANKAGLVIVDSLAASQPGIDENSTEAAAGLSMLGRVSEKTGATIVVIGHTGKNDLTAEGPTDERARPRGSSAIIAALGTAYAIGGKEREPKLVKRIKGRSLGSPMVEPFYLRPEAEHDEHGRMVAMRLVYMTAEQVNPPHDPRAELNADVERVVTVVQIAGSEGVAGADALAKLARIRGADARAAIKTAIERGLVVNARSDRHPLFVDPSHAPPPSRGSRPLVPSSPLKGWDERTSDLESSGRPGTSRDESDEWRVKR